MWTFNEIWQRLTIQGEITRIEVKRGSAPGKSCLETICAFSNERDLNGGYLVLGIVSPENSKTRQYEAGGVPNAEKLQADLATLCNESFNIPLRPNIKVETVDNKNFLLLYIPEVSPQEKPVCIKSTRSVYRRIGTSDVKISDSEIERFYLERQTQTYDTTPIKEATLDDMDAAAINAYRQLRSNVNPNAVELEYEDKELLYSINAITPHPQNARKYCATLAGLILFGKATALRRYFPMHRIDYILIEGTEWVSDPDERYQVIEIRDPLLLAIPRLATLVINDLPKTFRLEENSLQRQDIPLIPSKVIREAIVNAVMHRNYRTSTPIQIIRYADRLELNNPGYSLKPVNEIDKPGSLPRNPTIAAVLHELNFAEIKGTGGKAMLEAMLDANLTLPEFYSQREKDYFYLTLWTHHLLGEEDTQWLKQFQEFNLSHQDARVLALLRLIGKIDNFTYCIINNVDTLTASKKLTKLKNLGLIESQGRGRSTYYTLKSEVGLERESEINASRLGSATTSTLTDFHPLSEKAALKLSASDERASLEERVNKIGEQTSRKEIEKLVLELCTGRSRTSSELAHILKQELKTLERNSLKHLVRQGLLEITSVTKARNGDKTYRAVQK